MALFMVAYDLRQQGQNYTCVIEKLKEYPTHWHLQGSVWLIHTDKTATQIRDGLVPCLDNNDKLIVIKLARDAAWHGHGAHVKPWMDEHL